MALIPSNMKPTLLLNLHNGRLKKHPVLRRLKVPGHETFLDELWGGMKTVAFCEDEVRPPCPCPALGAQAERLRARGLTGGRLDRS